MAAVPKGQEFKAHYTGERKEMKTPDPTKRQVCRSLTHFLFLLQSP